eukprot:241693-Prymnesium_polylepis.1
MKQLQTIIRTNERVAIALGHPYMVQLGHIYVDLLNVYKAYSELINTAIATSGATNVHLMHTSGVRAMRAVKKETLRLLDTFIDKSEDHELVLTKFVPPLLDPVLGDYVRAIPEARDPEVLSLFCCLINKLQSLMTQEVPRVFEAVFKCTLDMITKNFEDFPEHRSNLFNLLRAINHHCFPALLADPSNFTLIIESIKWAFKHTERNVAETGLNTLLELLNNVQASQVMNDFYRACEARRALSPPNPAAACCRRDATARSLQPFRAAAQQRQLRLVRPRESEHEQKEGKESGAAAASMAWAAPQTRPPTRVMTRALLVRWPQTTSGCCR